MLLTQNFLGCLSKVWSCLPEEEGTLSCLTSKPSTARTAVKNTEKEDIKTEVKPICREQN